MNNDNYFDQLKTLIAQDTDNINFTKQGWLPIVMASSHAKILIIGQAPGAITQKVGSVFHDRSGDRLRSWLEIDENLFYNSGLIAVLPMDFYFPGTGKSGDLPPRKDVAAKWHSLFLKAMPEIALTILIGKYAQDFYLKNGYQTITDNVLNYQQFLPRFFPLIHPSPRNQIWIKKHPRFETEIIPELKHRVKTILNI